MKKDTFHRTYPIPGTIVFLVSTLLPLVLALYHSVYLEGQFGLGAFEYVLTERPMLMAMAESLVLAVCTTLISLWLGMAGARIMATCSFRGKHFYEGLYRLPFFVPPVLFAFGFEVAFGPEGLLSGPLSTLKAFVGPGVSPFLPLMAMVLVLSAYCTPMVITIVGKAWAELDYRVEHTALTLGTSEHTVFRTITRPRLKSSIRRAAAFVFLHSLTALAVVLILGTSSVGTIQTVILAYRNNVASALACISFTLGLVALAVFTANEGSSQGTSLAAGSGWIAKRPRSLGFRLWIFIYTLCSLLLVLCPLLAIIARSVLTAELTISVDVYPAILGSLSSPALKSLVYSLVIALVSALVSTAVAVRVSSRRLLDRASSQGIYLMALAMGPAVLALGLSELRNLVFTYTGYEIPSVLLVTIAHIALSAPIAILLVLPTCRDLPQKLSEGSRTLGFSPIETFRQVERPILAPALRAGFCAAFAFSLGELGATLMLGGLEAKTLPVQIYRLILSGDIQGACALGTVLIALCFVMFLLGRRHQRKCHA